MKKADADQVSVADIMATSYERAACQTGVVHLGFGAFHRSHQAVYLDDYMDMSGDCAGALQQLICVSLKRRILRPRSRT